jgi:hypothetical protein
MGRSKRRHRKPADEWQLEKKRNFGIEAAIAWLVTLGFWGRSAIWFYNERILRRHDEMSYGVFLVDLLVPIWAIAVSVEWQRVRRRQRVQGPPLK